MLQREVESKSQMMLEPTRESEPVFPKWLVPHASKVVWILLALITMLCLVQIALDLYYLIALGQNLIS